MLQDARLPELLPELKIIERLPILSSEILCHNGLGAADDTVTDIPGPCLIYEILLSCDKRLSWFENLRPRPAAMKP